MRKIFPLLGPNASLFLAAMSGMNMVFLSVLGVCFYLESATLFEELRINSPDMVPFASSRYTAHAYNCWLAAAMYAFTLLVVYTQNKFNTCMSVSATWRGSGTQLLVAREQSSTFRSTVSSRFSPYTNDYSHADTNAQNKDNARRASSVELSSIASDT